MAITKVFKAIIPTGTTSVAGAGVAKDLPSVTGTAIDCTTYYGGELTYRIANKSSAPNSACAITFQTSPDGANWFDYYTAAGDTTANSKYSASIQLDRGVMWIRALAYGNTLNDVTVEAGLQAVTGV